MTTAIAIARGAFGRVALLDMNTPLVGHAHPHCHILLKARGPDQPFLVGRQSVPVTDETAVLVNAWEHHHYMPRTDSARTLFLALYLEPDWLAHLERAFAGCDLPSFFREPCVPIGPEVRALRDRLVEQLRTHAFSRESIEEAIFGLAAAMIHAFSDWRDLGGKALTGRMQDFRIRRAATLIRSSQEQAELDAVAKAVGLSRPRFNQLFRMCVGVSPGIYAASVRLERAVTALGAERMPVHAVSDALGFSAQSNFTRFFQQHTGVVPSQFSRVVESLDGTA